MDANERFGVMKIRRGDRTKYEWSDHFTLGDFWKKGCVKDEVEVDERILKIACGVESYYESRIFITSTFRGQDFNSTVEGASQTSLHTKGLAIDFAFANKYVYKQFRNDIKQKKGAYWPMKSYGAGEFIFYKSFCHVGIQSKYEVIDKMGEPDVKADLYQPPTKSEIEKRIDREIEIKKNRPPVKEYYEYYHQDSSLKTVTQLINTQNSPVQFFTNKEQEFLDYQNVSGISNLDRIWELYNEEQKKNYSSEYKRLCEMAKDNPEMKKDKALYKPKSEAGKEVPINPGTLLYIAKNRANIEVISVSGKDLFMKQQGINTFMWDEFSALINDPGYRPGYTVGHEGGYSVQMLHLQFTVWIYIRAINRIMNITPFVKTVETAHGGEGGNFSFSLNDISDVLNVEKYGEGYYDYIQKIIGGKYSISWFQKYIRYNDIVWVRYEALDLEKREKENIDLFIDKSELPGKVYDMIGLVDNNGESFMSGTNMSAISVGGRDLTKLVQEDGCYFMPFALVDGGREFFLNYDPADSVFKRLFVGGEFMNLFASSLRSIRDSIGFIFNQLTNIGILPKGSDLFSAYKNSLNRSTGFNEDRVSKGYALSTTEHDQTLSLQDANGIWQIVKLLVDNQLDDRRLNNGELTHPEGAILDVIKKVCQQPFVEFFGDTYGDKYVFIARQAPFTKSQIIDYFNNNMIVEIEHTLDLNLNWDDTFYTYYQIQPLDGIYGSDQFIAGTAIPIVYFEEYAQVFGMHKKVVPDCYISAGSIEGEQGKTNIDLFRQALANDMKYLIETNAILPFTRKGTITIVGDKRIKRGSWIYFQPTDEIFYVKSVTQNATASDSGISRITSIEVERGMKRDYVLDNVYMDFKGKRLLVNYFNIVNIDVIVDQLQMRLIDDKIKLSNSATNQQLINKEIFNFFFRARQFSNRSEEANPNNTIIQE